MSETETQLTTREMLVKLCESAEEAKQAYDNDDLEKSRLKAAEVNNNIGNVLTMINIEEAKANSPNNE